jgi:histidinol-phosphate aminotransferase
MVKIPSHIQALSPYKPGRSAADIRAEFGVEDLVKLASNENPLGPSPEALKHLVDGARGMHLYPDGGAALRRLLGDAFGVGMERVICASGSEAVLLLALRTFLAAGDTLLASEGTFVGWQVLASASGHRCTYVPLRKDYSFDVDAIIAAVEPTTRIIYLPNPNNPTGTWFSQEEYEKIVSSVPADVLLILDEAYFEYAEAAAAGFPNSLVDQPANVLTLRTFSKIYGIAAARIGYGIGSREVIEAMLKVKLPFEPAMMSQNAGIAALRDTNFLGESVRLNTRELGAVTEGLARLSVKVPKSAANFVMIDCGSRDMAQALWHGLVRRGVITRPLDGFGLPHAVRVSIGLESENARFLAAFEASLAEDEALARSIREATASL